MACNNHANLEHMSEEYYLKSESIEINGLTFTTQQFPGMHSIEVMVSLVKLLGPTIATLLGPDEKSDISLIAPKLQVALAGVQPSELTKLIATMLTDTTVIVNGKLIQLNSQAQIEKLFGGRIQDIFKLFAHAVGVNYSDFFAEMLQSAPEAAPATTEQIVSDSLL